MTKNQSPPFYIVGIGTSAGGLEALEKFFTNMPPNSGLAFVILQHLSPNYESHMVGLLTKYTQMQVHEAHDGMLVEADSIYLLPRSKHMTIFKRCLYLTEYNRSHGLSLPIDVFFESLAQDMQSNSIGIILSGTGSDGSRGLRAIKEAGGMVIAQDDAAKFTGMPQSAIATQLVDQVLAVEKIPQSLLSYTKRERLKTNPNGSQATDGENFDVNSIPNTLNKLFSVLQKRQDIDFTGYKHKTILRRIERRMNIKQVENLEAYVKLLQQDNDEARILSKEFLIGVTRFFRDPEAFDWVRTNVIPSICQRKKSGGQLRLWVCGCSTGEEAYSLAIIIKEHLDQIDLNLDVKIFATDVDRDALMRASIGVYKENIIADLTMKQLNTYFRKQGDEYEIVRDIRKMVIFAYQNVIKDPPFSKTDLITCRNLLIYLDSDLQKKVLSTFQFSLRQQGYLFLGNSETVGSFDNVFRSANDKFKVFVCYDKQMKFLQQYAPSVAESTPKAKQIVSDQRERIDWGRQRRNQEVVLRSVIEQSCPPCLIIDDEATLLHTFGDVGPYLKPPQGYQVTLNLLSIVRQELLLPLTTALHQVKQHSEKVIFHNINLQNPDKSISEISLGVEMLEVEDRSNAQFVLITFEGATKDVGNINLLEKEYDVNVEAAQRISELERDLEYTNENLQATIEELETANEELQATNEELIAANEELQSTNEELQSVNEELLTVNNEYQAKIKDLTILNNDMDNLLKNTSIGILFLDVDLKIRKFTPAIQQEINLMDHDIGRPLNYITHEFLAFDLLTITQDVLETLNSREVEVQKSNQDWSLLKITPYRTHHNQIDGVVIISVNITRLKQTDQALQESQVRYALAAQAGKTGVWAYYLDTGRIVADELTSELLGHSEDLPTTYDTWMLKVPSEDRTTLFKAMEEYLSGQSSGYSVEHRVIQKDQTIGWMRTTGLVITDEAGQPARLIGFTTDITAQKHEGWLKLFETAIKASTDGIVIVDFKQRDMPIVYVNPAFEQLTGYSTSETIGQNCRFLQGRDRQQPARQTLREAIRSGGECTVTLRNYRKDGTLFWNNLSIYPLFDSSHELTHFVGIQREINKEKSS